MLEQEYEDDSLNCPCIVLLGDRKVGKTSLYKRFFEKKFLEELEATIVEDKYENVVEVEHTSKKIHILDTSGEYINDEGVLSYWIERGNCFILVYSIDEEETLHYLKLVYDLIKKNKKAKVPIFFVGNKCDLEKKVSQEDVKKLFGKNISLFETSAKDDINVDQAFNDIFRKLFKTKCKRCLCCCCC